MVDSLVGRRPVVNDDETGVVARGAVVERVAHALEVVGVGASKDGAVEVGAQREGIRISLGEGAVLGLGEANPELRDAVVVAPVRLGIGLVVAPHREEADAGIDQRLGCNGAGGDVGIVAVLRQVADLDNELYALIDEPGVDLVDDRLGHTVGVLASRVGGACPLGIGHDAEFPGFSEYRCGSYEDRKYQSQSEKCFDTK